MIRIVLAFLLLQFGTSLSTQYAWRLSLLKQRMDMTYHSTDLLTSTNPINLTHMFNSHLILPFSANGEDIIDSTSHIASPYVVQVDVVDESNQLSPALIRSIVLSGMQPLMHINYIPDGGIIDGGDVRIKMFGTLIKREEGGISVMSWMYPLAVNQLTSNIYLHIDELNTGVFTIIELSKIFHFVDYDYLQDGSLTMITSSNEMRISSCVSDVFITRGTSLIVSSNEFETTHVKVLPVDVQSTNICPHTLDTAVKVSDMLIYFNQRGIFQVSSGEDQTGTAHKINIEGLVNACVDHISVPYQRYRQDAVLISVEHQLYIAIIQDRFRGAVLGFEEVKDEQGRTACDYISHENCNIISHTFANHECCVIYILMKIPNDKYIVLEYSGQVGHGNWQIAVEFHGKLPLVLSVYDDAYVLLSPQLQNQGNDIVLGGISETSSSDGNIYLWGNVLLVFDKRSSTLTAIVTATKPSSVVFETSLVKQFTSMKEGNDFMLMTSNGEVWHGITRSFHGVTSLSKISKNVVYYTSVPLSNQVGLYYDSYNNPYALAIVDLQLKRHLIDFQHLNRGTVEQNLLTRIMCFDASTYSWGRQFTIHPPKTLLGIKSANVSGNDFQNFPDSDGIQLPDHTEDELIAFRSATYRIFTKQQIGGTQWWKGSRKDISSQWYFHNTRYEDYLEYVSVNNVHLNTKWTSYLSQYGYNDDRKFDMTDCVVPSTIYLDKDATVRLNISVSAGPDQPLLVLSHLQIFVSLSRNDLVNIDIMQYTDPLQTMFEVTFTGRQLDQHPPGMMLQSVSTSIWTWFPHKARLYDQSVNLFIKVGCPSALSLEFDRDESVRMLASRGRTDSFECLYDTNDGIPCFTTSEFVTTFYIENHVTGRHTPFHGNYTLQVVGGGAGNVNNINNYTDDEIAMYNYRPGDSKSLQSLIWTVLDESTMSDMKDNSTGRLIFDSKKPASIVFECRMDSPCGSIPFGTPNPSEFFLVIETSNKAVDHSTNCDFTMRFTIHLIGIELNPKSHFIIMVVTLSIILTIIFIYYQSTDGKGRFVIKRMINRKVESDEITQDHATQIQQILKQQRGSSITSTGGLHIPRRGSRRASLLTQSLHIDTSNRRKSIAVVADLRQQLDLGNTQNEPQMFQIGSDSKTRLRLKGSQAKQ